MCRPVDTPRQPADDGDAARGQFGRQPFGNLDPGDRSRACSDDGDGRAGERVEVAAVPEKRRAVADGQQSRWVTGVVPGHGFNAERGRQRSRLTRLLEQRPGAFFQDGVRLEQAGGEIDATQVLGQRQRNGFVECHEQAPFQKPAAVTSPARGDEIRKAERTLRGQGLENQRLLVPGRGTCLARSRRDFARRNTCAFGNR